MSRMNIEPLESYRLGRYALPIPCLLCGHDNLFDADACRHCSAPMALARSALRQKKHTIPQVLATLGPDGSGKSVFLGVLLDILSRQRERMDFTTCDASSVALQQEAIAALRVANFPRQLLPKKVNGVGRTASCAGGPRKSRSMCSWLTFPANH